MYQPRLNTYIINTAKACTFHILPFETAKHLKYSAFIYLILFEFSITHLQADSPIGNFIGLTLMKHRKHAFVVLSRETYHKITKQVRLC